MATKSPKSLDVMSTNPKLVEKIAEWRRLDAEAKRLLDAGDGKGADETDAQALDILWGQILDEPLTSVEDLVLVVALAGEAFTMPGETEEHFRESAEIPGVFLHRAMLHAQRLVTEGGAP